MKTLVGGAVAAALGLIGLGFWWKEFLTVLGGTIPAVLLLGGGLAIYLGFDEMKDTWKKEEPVTSSVPSDELEKYKSEISDLKRELEKALVGNGVGSETVKDIMGIIGDDSSILSNLVKSMKSMGEVGEPKEAIRTTGLFFTIGAVPSLIPFFIGLIWDVGPLIPAIMAFSLAVLTISTAGFFVAVLSGKKIALKIAHNISVIMGTCAVTYGVGLAARILFVAKLTLSMMIPALVAAGLVKAPWRRWFPAWDQRAGQNSARPARCEMPPWPRPG